ncbi:MAG: hypothetical protein PHV28_06465 [Kiritimatiellae bacterium]|nr:hypothetical protein [Kiritimatiellia bacterium]
MYMGNTHLFLPAFWPRRLTALALAVSLSSVLPLPAFAEPQTLASADAQSDSSVETTYSNAGDNDFGGTDLDNGQTVAEGTATLVNQSGSIGGDNANIGYSVDISASGQVQMGDHGVQASAEVGLQAELTALAQAGVGNDMFGANAAAEANVQAILKAQGQIGAYIDDKGLTIGVDAKAEAMVSAEASVSLTLSVFGVATNVTATASAQAGASASASALVTIGFDGKVSFKVGAGATAGVGAGVDLEFEVSAEALLNYLGLSSLDELIEWCQQFVQDPSAYIGQLINEAKDNMAAAVASAVVEKVEEAITETVTGAYDAAGDILADVGGFPGSALQSLFGGGNAGGGGHAGGGLPALGNSGSGGCGGASSGSGGASGGGSGGGNYKRDSQFKRWSK